MENTEEKEAKLQEILTERLNADFEKFRTIGVNIGWHSCCMALYEQCKNLTSAKAIKELLKQKCNESKTLLGLDKSEPTL